MRRRRNPQQVASEVSRHGSGQRLDGAFRGDLKIERMRMSPDRRIIEVTLSNILHGASEAGRVEKTIEQSGIVMDVLQVSEAWCDDWRREARSKVC